MSLSDRIRAFVPAVAVVGVLAGSPDVRADEPQKPQITAEEKQELDQDKYELEDGRFLYGDFTKFSPSEASVNPRSDYYQTFAKIRKDLTILAKYGRETIPDEYRDFRKACIDALLWNIFVDSDLRAAGVMLSDEVRDLLEREGVLDHDKQLEKLVESADHAYEEAKRIATLSKPGEHEKVVKVVELTQQHVLSLQQQAENSTRLALSLRLQPRTYAPDEMDEKRRDVIHSQQSALEHLVELRRAMDNGDLEKVQENLGAWKEQYQKGQAGMLRLVDMAGANVQFELGKDTEWKRISVGPGHDRYLGSDWATARFAEQWGEKGRNFYDKIGRLRGIQEGLESLGKYVEETDAKRHAQSLATTPEDLARRFFEASQKKDIESVRKLFAGKGEFEPWSNTIPEYNPPELDRKFSEYTKEFPWISSPAESIDIHVRERKAESRSLVRVLTVECVANYGEVPVVDENGREKIDDSGRKVTDEGRVFINLELIGYDGNWKIYDVKRGSFRQPLSELERTVGRASNAPPGEKKRDLITPETQKDQKYSREDISQRLSEVTDQEFLDLYVDVSNRQPELLGTFHDDPSGARLGPGAWPARIVEYHIEEILPWGNDMTLSKYNERQKKDGRIIKVSTTAENKTFEKMPPHTRRHYLYITKIDGKSKIVQVAW